jgi:hypothetical protein
MPAYLIRKATGEHFSVSNSLEKGGKFSNASFWSAFSAPPKNSALAIFVFDAYRTSSISQTEPKLAHHSLLGRKYDSQNQSHESQECRFSNFWSQYSRLACFQCFTLSRHPLCFGTRGWRFKSSLPDE